SSVALAAQLLGHDTRPSEAAIRAERKIRLQLARGRIIDHGTLQPAGEAGHSESAVLVSPVAPRAVVPGDVVLFGHQLVVHAGAGGSAAEGTCFPSAALPPGLHRHKLSTPSLTAVGPEGMIMPDS